MTRYNKESLSSSYYRRLEYQYIYVGDGRGGVGNRTTHFYSQKVDFIGTGMMGDFSHLRVLAQHPTWNHGWVSIIELELWVVLNLVLVMVMVKVVWFLGPPTFSPRKLIVGLMVLLLCNIRVGIIHTWVIIKNTGPLLHYIWIGMRNLEPMTMI